MVWLCFIGPQAPRHHGCRFWPLEWCGIGWADVDVIWVTEQGRGTWWGPLVLYGGSMGAGFVCSAVLENATLRDPPKCVYL